MSNATFEKLNQNLIRLDFEININATIEKIWDTLWNPNKINDWLKVFEESTYVVGNIEEGENIRFMNGNNSGMNTIVHSKITNKQVIFRHIGYIENGEVVVSDESKAWENAMEGYVITQSDNGCKLIVFLDTTEKYVDYFQPVFKKALEFIKDKCEN